MLALLVGEKQAVILHHRPAAIIKHYKIGCSARKGTQGCPRSTPLAVQLAASHEEGKKGTKEQREEREKKVGKKRAAGAPPRTMIGLAQQELNK